MSSSLKLSEILAFKQDLEAMLEQIETEANEHKANLPQNKCAANAVGTCGNSASTITSSSLAVNYFNAEAIKRKSETHACKSALERIDNGTFGYCVDCGNEIELSCLRAEPSISRCLSCQAEYDIKVKSKS